MTTTTKTDKRDLSKAERDAYALVGRVGGKATAKKLGKKHMQSIGKKGADARWQPKSKK